MSQDATSDASDTTNASATEEDTTQAEQALAVAFKAADVPDGDKARDEKPEASKPAENEDKLGDGGKRALQEERKARRDAEKAANALQARLKEFEDRDKTELQKAVERAEAAEKGASSMRVANTRLMAAATHNIPADLIDLLGNGTDEEIDARASLLAKSLASAVPQSDPEPEPEPERKKPAQTRPVESLTAGAKPADDKPTDMDAVLRAWAGRG